MKKKDARERNLLMLQEVEGSFFGSLSSFKIRFDAIAIALFCPIYPILVSAASHHSPHKTL